MGKNAFISGNPNERLIGSHNIMNGQDVMVGQARQIAIVAEGDAIQTMAELKVQRNVIHSSVGRNDDLYRNMDSSTNILDSMSRRAVVNQCIMLGVLLFLLCVFLYILNKRFKE